MAAGLLRYTHGRAGADRAETESFNLSLTCPNCGNAENFVAKTLQMQLLRVSGDQMQPPQEEGRPALVEVLCDECDSSVDLDALDEGTRRELLVTLGAR